MGLWNGERRRLCRGNSLGAVPAGRGRPSNRSAAFFGKIPLKLELAFRWRSQAETRNDGGKLFILRPRRAVRAAKFGDAAQKYIGPQSKTLSRLIQEFPFLDTNRGQAAAGTGVKERFSKEFSIGG